MRILVVEDDRKVASFLEKGLREEGYAVDVALDGTDGERMALVHDYDLLVLDIMLPGQSGLDVVRSVRAASSAVPVLLLTARDSQEDVVIGLDAGADDYLRKPFGFEELLARVKGLLREGLNTSHPDLRWEYVRLAGEYDVASAFAPLLALLESEPDGVTQFHLAEALGRISSGWSEQESLRLVRWLLGTQTGWFAQRDGKGRQFGGFWNTVVNQLATRHAASLIELADQLSPESEIAKVDNQGHYAEDRVDKRPAKLMWKADDAARAIVRGMQARKRELVITGHGRTAVFLSRLTPTLFHQLLRRA